MENGEFGLASVIIETAGIKGKLKPNPVSDFSFDFGCGFVFEYLIYILKFKMVHYQKHLMKWVINISFLFTAFQNQKI